MSRGRPSPGRDALGVYLQRPWLPRRLSPSRGPLPEESQPLLKGPHPPGHAGLAFHGRRVRLCSITGCWFTDQAQNWALKAAVDRASTPCATKSHSFRDRNSERGLPPPRCGPSSCKVIKANESICTTLDCKTEIGDEEVENTASRVEEAGRDELREIRIYTCALLITLCDPTAHQAPCPRGLSSQEH